MAVTGWGHEEDRRRSREMGFDLHLVKPVTAKDMRALLSDPNPNLGLYDLPNHLPEFARL